MAKRKKVEKVEKTVKAEPVKKEPVKENKTFKVIMVSEGMIGDVWYKKGEKRTLTAHEYNLLKQSCILEKDKDKYFNKMAHGVLTK